MTDKEIINKITRDPHNTLKLLSTGDIVKILIKADEAFFNTDTTIFSDDIYDIVKEYLRNRDENNSYLKKVGAKIEINKEKLPYYLGSLDKIKDNDKEIDRWIKKYDGNYIISEKLDGISCLLYYDNDNIKLYTRGDGYHGQNITHILAYLKNINTDEIKKSKTTIAIRGELIISRENWKTISHLGANARNMVAGVIHSKKINIEIISKVDFIAYEVMYPRQKMSVAYDMIKTLKIPLVKNIKMEKKELTNENLSNILQRWRQESVYEIDGIVIHHDDIHKIIAGKNPKYAFAFKTIFTHEQVEVIVTDVEWNVSKHRYMKPLVKFDQVNLGGVKIKQATGFNAGYIKNNIIGSGSRVIIVRSGDVIPHILKVLTPSSSGIPKMPDVNYIWNETGVDILLSGVEKNKQQDIQAFSHFMKTLDIDGVKEGVISKMYDNGYDTLEKIIKMSMEEIMALEGFQRKSSQKIYDEFQKIKEVECNKLLTASNVFGRGFGDKKIKLITDVYPYIGYDKDKALKLKVENITSIKGMANTTAIQFITKLPDFYTFCETLGIKCKKSGKLETQEIQETQIDENKKELYEKFRDKKVLFTGFRDKKMEQMIISMGGWVVTSLSKSLNYIISKDRKESNNKIEFGNKMNIPILYKEDIEKLML